MKYQSLIAAALISVPSLALAEEFDVKASIERGKPQYMVTCLACHQPTGMGLPGAFPPLGGSEYVTGSPRRLVSILLKGLSGPITVKGVTYNNVMLPVDVQFPQMKDDKNVADVVNYVRNSFGNTAAEAVTPALVAELRAKLASRTTPFTEAEIKDWKDDAAAAPATAPEPAK